MLGRNHWSLLMSWEAFIKYNDFHVESKKYFEFICVTIIWQLLFLIRFYSEYISSCERHLPSQPRRSKKTQFRQWIKDSVDKKDGPVHLKQFVFSSRRISLEWEIYKYIYKLMYVWFLFNLCVGFALSISVCLAPFISRHLHNSMNNETCRH